MTFNNLNLQLEAGIGMLTINRPKKLNALNKATILELHQALKALDQDQNVRVIVLTGSGGKAFVAGADISEFADFNVSEAAQLSREGQELLFDFAENLSTPIIAAINGFALGGGLELAMAAHIRVASSTARMGLPEVSLGVIPGYGGTQRLAQLVGKGRALQMITTAEMIDASKAEQWGLINQSVDSKDLNNTVNSLASELASLAPGTMRFGLEAYEKQDSMNFDEALPYLKEQIAKCFEGDDAKEGIAAFLEKRKPDWDKKNKE